MSVVCSDVFLSDSECVIIYYLMSWINTISGDCECVSHTKVKAELSSEGIFGQTKVGGRRDASEDWSFIS